MMFLINSFTLGNKEIFLLHKLRILKNVTAEMVSLMDRVTELLTMLSFWLDTEQPKSAKSIIGLDWICFFKLCF